MVFMSGIHRGIYDASNAKYYVLCQWLWSRVVKAEVQESVTIRNATKMRWDDSKPGPSGMSRDDAFALPHCWGGSNKLLELPKEGLYVWAAMEQLGCLQITQDWSAGPG